jgi:cold shock CspA family protein
MQGFKTVKRGQVVKYDLAISKDAGTQARNVEIVR